MPRIELTTSIAAPVQRVFDLARSVDLHTHSTAHTNERAVAGVTTGLIGPHQQVTWQAKHFGIRQSLTVRITAFDRPNHFADEMVRGAFRSMVHDHHFEQTPDGGTFMRDQFVYQSPLGVLGHIADALFLKRYMRALLIERNRIIKEVAESDAWQQYLPTDTAGNP